MGVAYRGSDKADSNVSSRVERYPGIGAAAAGELEEPTPEALKQINEIEALAMLRYTIPDEV